MKKHLLFISLLLLTTPALAQQNQGQNPGGQGQRQFQIDPAQRARMQAFQPVLDLSRTLRMLPELHKQKGLTITKTQASKLIPIIKDIQTRKSLKPQDADALLGKIEDVLTDPQLTWIDKQQIRRPGQGGQNGQNGQGGQNGQNRQGGQFQGNGQNGQGGQNRQGGQGGNRGFGGFQAMMTAANPFTVDPFKGQVTALMGVLQKVK
ncbi:hypothetical protein [Deinococcus cellulosilyticus]|uniref:Uncharacterized protein n=1 Tax=Deinococcus cellulosilyticus (strain DSM 18568 / NBRC 106333 / KACC 11606 / 5516J-15) TaxID=1223518 RepID=A0A511MVD4_DEIC1|nr:hypothetical protein [Deinococcus cellulosilyticus]GEM44535.1 hypothetical protein DC3_01700 [Deinococcus cellulosilyticus NBRC 106333 = KACC 11606]